MEKQIIKVTETGKTCFDVDNVIRNYILPNKERDFDIDDRTEIFDHNHTEGTTFYYILIDPLIKELEKQKKSGNDFVLFENRNYDTDVYFYKAELTTTNDPDFLEKTERENKIRSLNQELLQKKVDLQKEYENKLKDLNF